MTSNRYNTCKYSHTSLNSGISGLLHCREGEREREREGGREREREKRPNVMYTQLIVFCYKIYKSMTRICEHKVNNYKHLVDN
jgi:hypothetical protein